MKTAFRAFVLLTVLMAVVSAADSPKITHVKIPTVAARPEDVTTIDGMMNAWYGVISGPAGKVRDWGRDKTLYIPDIRFVSTWDENGQVKTRTRDHQAYVDAVDSEFTSKGFFEREINRVTERYGSIAHVWSTYESRIEASGPVTARGVNSIELFWDGRRWWVANGIWMDESKEHPLPVEYLPHPK